MFFRLAPIAIRKATSPPALLGTEPESADHSQKDIQQQEKENTELGT